MTKGVISITAARREVMRRSVLSEPKRKTLKQLEAVIQRYEDSRWDAAAAIARVHDEYLYYDYGTFEEYCEKRWGWRRRHGYQLIKAHKLMENVRQGAQIPPANERQVRPLAGLRCPEEMQEAWNRAESKAKDAGRTLTGAIVEQAVKEVQAEGGYGKQARRKKLKVGNANRVDRAIDNIETMADYLNRVDVRDDARTDEWANRLTESQTKISRFIARCRKVEKVE